MALTNTSQHYGAITKTFHWLMALMIFSLIAFGWYAENLPYDTDAELARKAWFFSMHKTFGVFAFFVAAARVLWAFSQPKPGLLNADHKIESFAAELVHWVLYAALIIVPLSGWISHAAASGFAPIRWPLGQNLPLIPKSVAVEHAFGALHWIAGKVLIGAVLLHIAGALKHHIIDRDSTLRRMLPGSTIIGQLPPQKHSRAPLFGAAMIWISAMMFAFLQPGTKAAEGPSPELAQVTSEWQVEDGSLDIIVTQFGNEVPGRFAVWTAAINFDENATGRVLGDVRTEISIPSLTLGSVTDQAMGPDFFDVTNHPTAVFSAQIMPGSDDYLADGTLTIKGRSVALSLPFALSIDGDTAEMRADLILDRRDLGIGDNMADESSLAFAVKVQIRLNASRGAK